MDAGRQTIIWMLFAGIALWLAIPGLVGGEALLLPLFLSSLCLVCAVHHLSRAFVMEKIVTAFSGGALRTALIVLGAAAMIQVLPLELALFAAGDILAYVELLTAVSLIAANTRLAPFRAVGARWIAGFRDSSGVRLRGVARSARAIRPPRRKRRDADDVDGAAGWAFA